MIFPLNSVYDFITNLAALPRHLGWHLACLRDARCVQRGRGSPGLVMTDSNNGQGRTNLVRSLSLYTWPTSLLNSSVRNLRGSYETRLKDAAKKVCILDSSNIPPQVGNKLHIDRLTPFKSKSLKTFAQRLTRWFNILTLCVSRENRVRSSCPPR